MRLYPLGAILFLMIALALLLFSSSGCKKDEPITAEETSLTLEFYLLSDNKLVNLNDPIILAQGYRMRHQLFKFYLDNVKLVNTNNEPVELSEVILPTWRNAKDGRVSLTFKPKAGTYKAMQFGLGLDSARNATNPNSVPIDHPLSSAQGTHWDAWTNYRFVMLEGDLDTTLAQMPNFNMAVIVHTGMNFLYRKGKIENFTLEIKEGGKAYLRLAINLDKLYQGTDFKKDNISHTIGGEALATLITDNFLSAFGLLP